MLTCFMTSSGWYEPQEIENSEPPPSSYRWCWWDPGQCASIFWSPESVLFRLPALRSVVYRNAWVLWVNGVTLMQIKQEEWKSIHNEETWATISIYNPIPVNSYLHLFLTREIRYRSSHFVKDPAKAGLISATREAIMHTVGWGRRLPSP